MEIALCLSGGGSRGFAHLGVLEAMDELGIKPMELSGSSAGALVAVLYAGGVKPKDALEKLSKIPVLTNLRFGFSKYGFLSNRKLCDILLDYLPQNSFDALQIPTHVCAVDIENGIPVYFNQGSLIDKVQASSAIPILFKPVIINGTKYLDGGLMDNLPIKPLLESKYPIVGINVTPFQRRLPIRGIKDIAMKSLFSSLHHQTMAKKELFKLLIEPEKIAWFNGLNTKQARKMYEVGYKEGMQQLKHLV